MNFLSIWIVGLVITFVCSMAYAGWRKATGDRYWDIWIFSGLVGALAWPLALAVFLCVGPGYIAGNLHARRQERKRSEP